jgi:ABC-type uncharacterized transport system permease subunit
LAELLFWPALVAYGEAAVALGAEARRPGLAGRLGIWGVRVGWLLQTALLAVQAARADGFPWADTAGALNLLAWLVVGGYLIWGCRPGYRLLGLGVMPVAAALLVVAYAAGGVGGVGGGADGSGALLAFHVATMLAAFAGFTVAGALAVLYLLEARRLKRREPRILRFRMPPLEALDRLSARTVVVSLAVLTAGIALGVLALVVDGGGADAVMGLTVGAWLFFAALVVARPRGRRRAALTLAGLALVLAVLPIVHFAG